MFRFQCYAFVFSYKLFFSITVHEYLPNRQGAVLAPSSGVYCGNKSGGSQVRNPIPLKIRRAWGLLHSKSYIVAKRPPVGEGVPAQVSSSSSDVGSKLRSQSLNSPRVSSKWDVNLT
ncbi:hypothetical protein AVEN_271156-1 [Araneus ventricosus]|uniref:Uncharacterized protein n=1 Tax=Araneus ventricosus TaxID=182803 RepID=A0A4Y2T627_ARAVE|nr:hypothetical protein AVEN_271156-1 [Araneus ventricosus]